MLSAPTTSSHWYRVANLHPRLRNHVEVQRQRFRGEDWYLLMDRLHGRTHRLNARAYAFVGRCNGDYSVEQLWDYLLAHDPEQAPTQDEVIALLIQLNLSGLLQCEHTPDIEALFSTQQRERRQNRKQAMNPLAFKVGLINPSAILKTLETLGNLLFNKAALWCWLILTGVALLIAAINWPALQLHASTWLLTPQGLVLTWLAFPFVKLIHELAHGLAVRRWGGEVTKAGITLLMLTPVPFVDASAAWAFRESHRRFLVSAAGIMAELAVAAVALILWTQLQPGMARDMALAVAAIGGVSTVLFNGNPLLRFDGYHMLADALQIPNLHGRSGLYWRFIILRQLLRLRDAVPPEAAPGERPWLIGYSPLSWFYRLFLSLFIVTWLGGWSPIIAFMVGAFALWSLLFAPLRNLWLSLGRQSTGLTLKRRARWMLLGWCSGLVLIAVLIPMPFSTLTQGVLWIPENAQLRAQSAGFIVRFNAADGSPVAAGDSIATLSDPALLVQASQLRSALKRHENEQYRLMLTDPVEAANLASVINRMRQDLSEVETRIAQLEIRAGIHGRLSIPHQEDLEGRFLDKGELIGRIITDEPAIARVALAQAEANLVMTATRAVTVRLAEHADETYPAHLLGELAAASSHLPSAALADRSGGQHRVDPADPEGLRSREPVFIFDLALPVTPGERIGGRAWVRFEHAPAPLALQWGRRLQQLFLSSFNPGG